MSASHDPAFRLRRRLLRCWEIGLSSVLLAAVFTAVLSAPELHAAIKDHRSLQREDTPEVVVHEVPAAHCGNAQTSAAVYTR